MHNRDKTSEGGTAQTIQQLSNRAVTGDKKDTREIHRTKGRGEGGGGKQSYSNSGQPHTTHWPWDCLSVEAVVARYRGREEGRRKEGEEGSRRRRN